MDHQTYYVHSLTGSSPVLGPFRCSPGVNIADHLLRLLEDKLPVPSADKDRVFVVVHPCDFCSQICTSSTDSANVVVDIYELLLESQEPGVSLDDVRNQLYVSYGRDRYLLEEETLCVWTARGHQEQCLYSDGSIFTATKCIFKTHLNMINSSRSIRPEINKAIIEPTEESPPSAHSDHGQNTSKRDTPPNMPEPTLSISTEHAPSHPRDETIPVVLGEQVSSTVPSLVEVEPAGAIVASEQVLPNLRYKLPTRAYSRPCGGPTRTFSEPNLASADIQKKESTLSGSVSLPQLRRMQDEDCEKYDHEERFQSCENEGTAQQQWEGGNSDDTHSQRIHSSIQEEGDDCKTGEGIQHSLPVATFDVEPAFLSNSNDLQSYLRQIEEKGDAGTPPGKNHPILVTPLNILLPNRLSNHGDHEVVMLPRPKRELIGGDECWTVYRMESLLPHSVVYRESGFLSTDVLKSYGVDDMTALYCSKGLTEDTKLRCGDTCRTMLPSPASILQLCSGNFRFIERTKVLYQELQVLVDASEFNQLARFRFIRAGGNGATFEWDLGTFSKYAVKLTRYNKQELDAWLQFDHPNIVPLCAVIWATPRAEHCYQVMPRMTDDLGSLMKSAGDLCTLAKANEITWEKVKCNVRHILGSVLRGMDYLHSKFYQHCDLKESNILILMKCQCADILDCGCDMKDKFQVAISDFDSVKPFSHSCSSVGRSGTLFYRPPEVNKGQVHPKCDIWSFGMIVCRLCHSSEERNKILVKCESVGKDYTHKHCSLHPEEILFSREMLISLQHKSHKAPLDYAADVPESRLTAMARIAKPSLDIDISERPTAQMLLEDPFFN